MSWLQNFERGQREWLDAQFQASLVDSITVLRPSEWAEQYRYLPPSVTPMPGYYRFDVAPYIREPLDCLSVDSPIRGIAIKKGVQLCLTVGVIENAIGYGIAHVRTAPMMMVTADAELAKSRLDSYIIPMLEQSGLANLIHSADEGNNRKTGRTSRKIEFDGGGFFVPLGAQNANKLRSISIEWLLNDEIDAWPLVVGKDGDPLRLVKDRTAAFEPSRKVVDISTPTIKGVSKIAAQFDLGDQRRYFVCCLSCGFPQVLRWRRQDSSGMISGILWETENDVLITDSVRYACQNCGHEHFNDDKTRLLSPDNGAEWRPTAESKIPNFRSYHISSLYSPVGMQTWTACVQKYLEAWDVKNNRTKDNGALQVFYNNVLGEEFELHGESVRLSAVSEHKRAAYKSGEIPNSWASEHCGSPVLLLTCAVDVHKHALHVVVFGWCRDRRALLVEYLHFEGNTEQKDDPGTWGELSQLVEQKRYIADDGKEYGIILTLIDSGYSTTTVYEFCAQYSAGVYAVKGRDVPAKSAALREFSEFKSPLGSRCFMITVDFYKDRWSTSLRREWDGVDQQPVGFFNAPWDLGDKELKELTVETKVIDPKAKSPAKWVRPSGSANELWDLLVYNNVALELIAWDLCHEQWKFEAVDWVTFYDHCAAGAFFS